jgi:hypothetical protein
MAFAIFGYEVSDLRRIVFSSRGTARTNTDLMPSILPNRL